MHTTLDNHPTHGFVLKNINGQIIGHFADEESAKAAQRDMLKPGDVAPETPKPS